MRPMDQALKGMRAVVGEETEITERELNNRYDCIMQITRKKAEEKDNKDYLLMTHWTQLKIGMSTLR